MYGRFLRDMILTLVSGCLFFAGLATAQVTELQTFNANFNDSLSGWSRSGGTADIRVDSGFLVVAGQGGALQIFELNGKSKFQIATCIGRKASDGWMGFGVVYYDALFNEIGSQQKEITADFRNGDSDRRFAIGLVPPDNAAYGALWVWNDDSSGWGQVDDFRVVNYFPDGNFTIDSSQPPGDRFTQTFPGDRNLLTNGSFETVAFSGDENFEGDEFWNVAEFADSVFVEPAPFITGPRPLPYGLHIGSPFAPNVVYQRLDAYPLVGRTFTMRVRCGRDDDGASAAAVGVDFYDADGNKLGDASVGIVNQWRSIMFGGPSVATLDFSPPAGTANVVTWLWADQGAELWLTDVIIKEAFNPE